MIIFAYILLCDIYMMKSAISRTTEKPVRHVTFNENIHHPERVKFFEAEFEGSHTKLDPDFGNFEKAKVDENAKVDSQINIFITLLKTYK